MISRGKYSEPRGADTNGRSFDLNLLHVLESVHRNGSVTAAAHELHLGQPAVTKRLGHLRRIFRDPLFIRTPAGVGSTAKARMLASTISRSFEPLRRAVDHPESFEPRNATRTFRLCMSDLAQMVVLPRLMAWSAQIAPQLVWHLVQGSPQSGFYTNLDSGDADLAVGYFARADDSLRCRLMFEDHYVGVVRNHHPSIRGELTVEQFLHAPHLTYQPADGAHKAQNEAVEKLFLASHVRRRVAISLTHTGGLCASIRGTDALALLPNTIAQEFARTSALQVLPLPVELPKVRVAQYWHARNHCDPSHRWLRGSIALLFGHARKTDSDHP